MALFADVEIDGIGSSLATAGEPTALVTDDGLQIDLWFGAADGYYYTYSTDGTTWAAPTKTNVPSGSLRGFVLKDGSTYYLFNAPSDASIHLYTSSNKTTWADQGVVLAKGAGGTWDDSSVANTFVWKEGTDSWYMLYEANASVGGAWSIGLATASAPGGPWTKYASNPVLVGVFKAGDTMVYGVGGPAMPRIGSTVQKVGSKYLLYYHGYTDEAIGPHNRAYSTDLHSWTVEGPMEGPRHDRGTRAYADLELTEFDGKSYLFWSASNQVDSCYIDAGVDNRPLSTLLALPPYESIRSTGGWGKILETASPPADWETSGFDDSGWAAPIVCTGPFVGTAIANTVWITQTDGTRADNIYLLHRRTFTGALYGDLQIWADNTVLEIWLNGTSIWSGTHASASGVLTVAIPNGTAVGGTNVLAIKTQNGAGTPNPVSMNYSFESLVGGWTANLTVKLVVS